MPSYHEVLVLIAIALLLNGAYGQPPDASLEQPDTVETIAPNDESVPNEPNESPPKAVTVEIVPPTERLQEGWARVLRGDYIGGSIMAEQVLALGDPNSEEEAYYLLGFSVEWSGAPDEAIAHYDYILKHFPDGNYFKDALFRRIESLGNMGRHDEALKLLKANFKSDRSLSPIDRNKIALLRGVWLLQSGSTKGGLKSINRALNEVSNQELEWYQAQARSALVDHAKGEIERLFLTGSQRKITRTLIAQANLVKLAEAQLESTIALKSSHWILYQVKAIGDCYVQLGQHLLTPPSLAALGDSERTAYRAEVAPRVENVYVKALKYYDLGLEHAGKVQWSGEQTESLRQARAEVIGRLDALYES